MDLLVNITFFILIEWNISTILSEDEAMSLLENGEYGVLSISSPEEGVYGIPINYVWDKQQSIYFHCAPEGRALYTSRL